MAIVKKNSKGDKIIVFKYKSKVRYRRKNGHRQLLTSLNIDKILPPGAEDVKPEKPVKKTAPKKAVQAVKPTPEASSKKTEDEKPTAKVPTKKTATAAKPVAKKAPVKKTEEKPHGT
jgi:large subunit ribosomal protein L21